MLALKTFRKFGIAADPFTGDVVKADDVYLTDETRFIADYLLQTAKTGGMVALLGESGSGKTTIRRYAVDRMEREEQKVRIIAPRTIDKTRSQIRFADLLLEFCRAKLHAWIHGGDVPRRASATARPKHPSGRWRRKRGKDQGRKNVGRVSRGSGAQRNDLAVAEAHPPSGGEA
jgi:energy-coupling factor transporter ATP-binding protein EcfA2